MARKSWRLIIGLTAWLAASALASNGWGATFGKVVAIGGHAADLALDEARGVLYVANFTANRIEVMSLADLSIQTSINVAPQPGSMAISPDGRHLVVAHFGNFQPPGSPNNALTVIDLNTKGKQTFALGFPPLGVAFGIDNRALIATTQDFVLFDPVTGAAVVLDTVSGLVAKTLPVPPANFPPNIVAASVNVSGDGLRIYGLSDTIEFGYDVGTRRLEVLHYVSSPPQGPRVVSVSRDGSYYTSGWALNSASGVLLAQFPNPAGLLHVGSHAVDSDRGVIYAQIPESTTTTTTTPPAGTPSAPATQPPVLQVLDADNLAVRQRLQLPENLAGKSVLTPDGSALYAISDSGVLALPVGSLSQAPRVAASAEDLVFRGNFCDRRVNTQEVTILDPGGGATDFSLTVTVPGISVTPASGVTPATVRVSVDPNAFQNQKGTAEAFIQVRSTRAVNLAPDIRVLINGPEPDQRGTFINVPGKLVDILADPFRDRFFVLRQDANQVLVFDGKSYGLIATLRTGNTPTSMAITFDRRYLLVGNDNSQIANVFDLETLGATPPIRFPFGHYPRSLAASGRAILAATRVAGPIHKIDRVDMATRSAVELPTLGVYNNDVDINTALVASPNGSSILAAQANGNVLLYNANVDSFTVSRKDTTELAGAYAASSFDQFVAGNRLMNASLVTVQTLESGTGTSSGFAFVDLFGVRTTAPSSSSPGVIQRVDPQSGQGIRATRMVEAPLLGKPGAVFTRTLAPLYSRNVIISLTTSGFTVLPWDYDASVAPPKLERVVNAADFTAQVAPGGLISIFGQSLSPVNLTSRQLPLPTALGESCLTVNGVPMPVLFVSPQQINAQMPFNVDGNVTMILRTPGGVSDNFNLTVLPAAPSVFRSGVAGSQSDIPTVVRDKNGLLVTPSNPIHRGETIVIYSTGLGRTIPAIDAGVPAPVDPLAVTLIEPRVTLAGVGLPIAYAGLSPGQVGVYQINAHVPWWVPIGMEQPLVITQGGAVTSLTVRVVD